VRLGSVLLDIRRALSAPCVGRSFPLPPVTLVLQLRFILTGNWSLLEFLTASLSSPPCRPDQLPRFSAPTTTSLDQAPTGVDHPRPLPVPLSGFHNLSAVSQQVRVLRPCFMPQPFGILPSEFSPHRNRAPLPGSLCSLAVLHQRAEWPSPGTYHRRFPRRPRF